MTRQPLRILHRLEDAVTWARENTERYGRSVEAWKAKIGPTASLVAGIGISVAAITSERIKPDITGLTKAGAIFFTGVCLHLACGLGHHYKNAQKYNLTIGRIAGFACCAYWLFVAYVMT